jgi:hypothetical protein
MTRQSFRSIGVAVVVLMAGGPAGLHPQEAPDVAAVQRFERSIADYAALRRDVACTVPALEVSDDAWAIRRAIDALAHAIRAARPDAAAGDIFRADVAAVFRSHIQRTFLDHGYDTAVLLAEINEDVEGEAAGGIPVVNGPFPWARGSMMLPSVLAALPPLPDELQYRFVDRDLVLVDVDAGLVVDVLPDALDGE